MIKKLFLNLLFLLILFSISLFSEQLVPPVYADTISALKFGNYSYATTTASPNLEVPADLTLEAWAKWNDGEMGVGWNVLFRKTYSYGLQVYRDTQNSLYRLLGYVFVSGTPRLVNGFIIGNLEDGNWHHFALTINKSQPQGGHIWLDGSEVSKSINNDLTLGITDPGGNAYLGYGGNEEQYMVGSIDEVRISNTVRYHDNFSPQITGFNLDSYTVALWHIDEGTGTQVNDASSNGNNLSFSPYPHNPTWVGGFILPELPPPPPEPTPTIWALNFANAAYLTSPTSSTLEVPADLTIEAWGKWDSGEMGPGVWNVFLRKTYAYGLQVYRDVHHSLYRLLGYVFVSGTPRLVNGFISDDLEDGNWHHFAMTIDKSELLGHIWFDGVEIIKNINDELTQGTTDIGGNFYLGYGGNEEQYMVGSIDEVRISKIARYTSNFIPQTKSFNPDSDTVALWHLDEGVGAIVADSSGNVNDLTFSVAPNIPTWVEGYIQLADTIAPTIIINLPSGSVSSNVVPIDVTITDDNSGVASYRYYLDGVEIPNTQTAIDLTYYSAGSHTFSVTAEDYSQNVATQSSIFTYSPTTNSLHEEVDEMYIDGEITKLGSSIYDKLTQAQTYINAEDYINARATLNALINQIEAQIDIHITQESGNLLIGNINYLLSTLP